MGVGVQVPPRTPSRISKAPVASRIPRRFGASRAARKGRPADRGKGVPPRHRTGRSPLRGPGHRPRSGHRNRWSPTRLDTPVSIDARSDGRARTNAGRPVGRSGRFGRCADRSGPAPHAGLSRSRRRCGAPPRPRSGPRGFPAIIPPPTARRRRAGAGPGRHCLRCRGHPRPALSGHGRPRPRPTRAPVPVTASCPAPRGTDLHELSTMALRARPWTGSPAPSGHPRQDAARAWNRSRPRRRGPRARPSVVGTTEPDRTSTGGGRETPVIASRRRHSRSIRPDHCVSRISLTGT